MAADSDYSAGEGGNSGAEMRAVSFMVGVKIC